MVRIRVLGKVKDCDSNYYYIVEEFHTYIKSKRVIDSKLYVVKDSKHIDKEKVLRDQQIVDVIAHSLFLSNKTVLSLSKYSILDCIIDGTNIDNEAVLNRIKHYFRAEEDDKLRGLVSECEGEGVSNLFSLHYVDRVKSIKKIHDTKPILLDPSKEDPTGLFVYVVEYNSKEVKRKYSPFILVRQYVEGADLTFISRDLMSFMYAYFNKQLQYQNEKSI